MRNLTAQNAIITPDVSVQAGVKNFISMDIDEFLIGSDMALPISEEGGFVVWINHQTEIDAIPDLRDNKTFMFHVLKQYEKDNFEAEEAARILTEKGAHAFINRMANDSRTGVFWGTGYQLPKANINPVTISRKGTRYVGWMVDFNVNFHYSQCVNDTEWHDLNP